MILFSTLNQSIVFWLFCYLGFTSGVVFFAVFRASQLFDTNKILKKNITKKHLKEKEEREKGEEKKSKKFVKIILKIMRKILRYSSIILCTSVFILVIVSSYLINLILNYGEVNFINLFTYMVTFLLADMFIKTVAKFLYSFYNKKRMRKQNR